MEVYEAMWSRFVEKEETYLEAFQIRKIDGVSVHCTLSTRAASPTLVTLCIESDWNDQSLYEVKFRSAADIKGFVESVGRLRYDRTRNRIVGCACSSLAYDLLMLLPVSENITTAYDDCSVCLEKCQTKTSCCHYLCQVCESSLNQKVCPICRRRYEHFLADIEEE